MEWIDDWAKDWEDDPSRIDIASLVPVLRVARLGILIEAFRTEVLRNFELTPREFDVLGALRGVGLPRWMNPSQLYGPLHLSSGGTTKILKRLTGPGLIERSPDPTDGRSVRVRITGRGRGLHDRALRAIAAASTQVLEASSPAELSDIDGALERLLSRLDHARADED